MDSAPHPEERSARGIKHPHPEEAERLRDLLRRVPKALSRSLAPLGMRRSFMDSAPHPESEALEGSSILIPKKRSA